MRANGVLPVDKPAGCTSRDVVAAVQRFCGVEKAGHCGTLDPLATGVLVVCLGRGTLVSRYLSAQGKSYEVEAMLGVETDTYDSMGTVTARRAVPPLSEVELEAVIERFGGTMEQVPPPYSAVKLRGRPLYSYARQGIEVEPEPREVRIDRIELVSLERRADDAQARLRVSCGPGTYIRSLVHDIGGVLGCGACVSALRRTRAGIFSIEDAVGLDELEGSDETAIAARVVTMERATDWMRTAVVSAETARGVRLGHPLTGCWTRGGRRGPDETLRVLDEDGCLLAFYGPARVDDGPEIAARALRVIKPLERAQACGDFREDRDESCAADAKSSSPPAETCAMNRDDGEGVFPR